MNSLQRCCYNYFLVNQFVTVALAVITDYIISTALMNFAQIFLKKMAKKAEMIYVKLVVKLDNSRCSPLISFISKQTTRPEGALFRLPWPWLMYLLHDGYSECFITLMPG